MDRNKSLFEDRIPSVQRIVYLVLGVVGMMGNKQKVSNPRISSTLLPVDKTLAWFDGVAQLNGTLCSVGGVLKVDDHSKYRWTLNCGRGTNSRAELMGAWATLTLATRLSIFELYVLGDSKIVIDWLNRKGSILVENLDGWKERIIDLIPLFRSITFAHIYREENKEVDLLSKKALYLRQGQITYSHWVDGHEGPTLFLNMY
jgi:ribonuclease HI